MYEGKLATPWEHTADVVNEHVAQGLVQLPKQPDVQTAAVLPGADPQQQQGVKVILQRGCGGCHTIPNIPGAAGTIGPNLGADAIRPPVSAAADDRDSLDGTVPNNSESTIWRRGSWIRRA